MTGGASAGTTSSRSTKKALWWTVLVILGIIMLIWIAGAVKGNGQKIATWLTHSPTDIVEGPPGVFHVRGESAQTIAERSAKNNLPLVGRFYDPRSTIALDKDWQGVVNTNPFKKVVTDYVNNDVFVEIRLDEDDRRIHQIPPSNWTEPTTLKLGDAKILQWRIRSDQTGPASVVNSLVDK